MLGELKAELEQLAASNRFREIAVGSARMNGVAQFRGRQVLDFASWDPLDLGAHPRVRRAAQLAVEQFGLAAGSPRLLVGTNELITRAEQRVAQLAGFQKAVLFTSRAQAILSLISVLTTERDAVHVDEQLQSPAGDAAYLTDAALLTFPTGNLAKLKADLERTRTSRRRLVIVESVSPLSGEPIDVGAFALVCQGAGAELVVDESYALSTVGLRGAGGSEGVPLRSGIFAIIADASIGLATPAGFIAGPEALVSYLVNRSRTFSSETATSPATAAALEAAIDIAELDTGARERLRIRTAKVREALVSLGIGVGSSPAPIICIPFPKPSLARELAEALLRKGILVEVVRAAGPLKESSAVRILLSLSHSDRQIESLLQALSEIYTRLDR